MQMTKKEAKRVAQKLRKKGYLVKVQMSANYVDYPILIIRRWFKKTFLPLATYAKKPSKMGKRLHNIVTSIPALNAYI
jgi:hypothetical protein